MESTVAHHIVERSISWTLRIGVWASAALMLLGLALAWFSPDPIRLPGENPHPLDVLRYILTGSLDPVTLMFAGLLLLMLTPFLRVLTAVIGFAVERDGAFVMVALLVFALLLGELVFSLR